MPTNNLIHLDYAGKSSRVSLQSLPKAHPLPPVQTKTSLGSLTLTRLMNGINRQADPDTLSIQDLIQSDPELNPDRAGSLVDPETLMTAYFDPTEPDPVPVSDFKFIDIILDPQGNEKERRPHVSRQSNINQLQPVKVGKRIPLTQALYSFVFKHTYQLVHEDGVQRDFLYSIADDLGSKQEVALLGAGSKGNQPLVVREKGNLYRAFLYGEVGKGDQEGKYKLLLLLSDQELKIQPG